LTTDPLYAEGVFLFIVGLIVSAFGKEKSEKLAVGISIPTATVL
jgi:hypothetical protein